MRHTPVHHSSNEIASNNNSEGDGLHLVPKGVYYPTVVSHILIRRHEARDKLPSKVSLS